MVLLLTSSKTKKKLRKLLKIKHNQGGIIMRTIHPKQGLTDQTIFKVITTLFGQFRQALKQGQYVFFPPDQIVISGEGKRTKIEAITKPVSEEKPNIKAGKLEREAWRLLGVSLYHFITGKSERNDLSYWVDGYGKVLCCSDQTTPSLFWPWLNLLLAEQECPLNKVKVQDLLKEMGRQIQSRAKKKETDEKKKKTKEQSLSQQDGATSLVDSQVSPTSATITRTVIVNYDLSPQEALAATRRVQYTNKSVVAAMPKNGIGQQEVTVEFFKLGHYVSDAELAQEYEKRGLTPVDPFVLSKVNELEPSFADEYPIGTHWQDEQGRWCFATSARDFGERRVGVGRHVCGWDDCWWFAGVRK